MSVNELEAQVLQLESEHRARLAEKLLSSLEDLSEEENARLPRDLSEEEKAEAANQRRDTSWPQTADRARSAQDVFRDARACVG